MMEPSPSQPRVAAEAVDLLSSLPAPLLEEILRRVALRDAVSTSALSRDWRRRWESVPGLDLSFPDGTLPGVVDRILLLYYTDPPVSRFAFHFDEESLFHVFHWVMALSRRSVQSISVRPSPNAGFSVGRFFSGHKPISFTLHSSIFSCAHLVSLHLENCDLPPLPVGFAGFPVLEDLRLITVDIVSEHSSDPMERPFRDIIRGSPLLRVLSLVYLYSPLEGVIEIESPNLHSLTLRSDWDTTDYRFGELPCLQAAKIDVETDFREFLAGLCHVRELTFITPDDYQFFDEEDDDVPIDARARNCCRLGIPKCTVD